MGPAYRNQWAKWSWVSRDGMKTRSIFRLKNGGGMARWYGTVQVPLTIQCVGTIVLGDRLGNILKARVGKQLNHGSSVVLFEGLLV